MRSKRWTRSRRVDLKGALRGSEEGQKIGPHAGPEHLIAYRQGTLSAAEQEALREHLSLCRHCTALLLELRDFEAAAAATDASAPREAWKSLVQRLPEIQRTEPVHRPAAWFPGPQPKRRPGRFLYAAAAALLLAVLSLSLWALVTVQQERRRAARLEQRLGNREAALAAAQRSLAETKRQLAAARERTGSTVREPEDDRAAALEARVIELTSEIERLRRAASAPERRDQLAARDIGVTVTPRFALRGQEPGGGFLRGGGMSNVAWASEDPLSVALDLGDQPVFGEYRLELSDREGKVLWSGRKPGRTLLGDAGTSVSFTGLAPGLYRLRIEGLSPDRTQLLAEYVLEVRE